MIPLQNRFTDAFAVLFSSRKFSRRSQAARRRLAMLRAVTARQRFGLASRAAFLAGAMLLGSRAASFGQGAITGDTQYNFQNTAGLFSTGFTPTFPTAGDLNGELNFGGTATYVATDDLANANVNDLTFTDTALVTITPSAATNVLTLTPNSLGIAPSIYVGTGGATINTILAGTNGFVKNGTGTLTLATNADTFTGNATVNAGTLTLNIGQSATAAFYLNNGATLNGNQGLTATNFVYGNSGTASLGLQGSSATVGYLVAGNGNLNLTAGITNPGQNANSTFGNFGGTLLFNATSNGIRLNTGANNSLNPFANFDLGTAGGNLSAKYGSQTLILGGLQGTGTGTSVGAGGNGASGRNLNIIVGSANLNQTFAGTIINFAGTSAGGTLFKVGSGTLTLTGLDQSANTYNSGFSNFFHGGTLLLDESVNSTILAAASVNAIGYDGTLYVRGKAGGTTSETMASMTVQLGGGILVVNPNGGTSTTVNLGALTATAVGGAFNIQPSNVTLGTGTATVTTTTNKLADGTYGGRITFGSDWATTTSTASPYTLSAYSGYTALPLDGSSSATVDYLQTGSGVLAANSTVNSLKIVTTAAGQALDFGGNTLSLTNGGLLFAGTNNYTLGVSATDTIKSLNSATVSDLIVQQLGTGTLTLNAVIANGGSGASTLTKAGPGTLILGNAANTYTGATYIDNGILSISSNANLGAVATGAALGIEGGTLQATSTFALNNGGAGTNDRNVAIGSGGGTIDVTGGNTLTVSGVVAVAAGNEYGPLIKTDSGTLVLSNVANTYTGATIINGGILSVGTLANGNVNSSIGNSPATANALVINGGTLQYTGAAVSTNRTFTVGTSGATLDGSGTGGLTFSSPSPVWYTASGSRTLTLTGTGTGNVLAAAVTDPAFDNSSLTGSTSLTKGGTGQWTLNNTGNTFTGATTVGAGTLFLAGGSTNLLPNSSVITVGATVGTPAILDVTGQIGGGLTINNNQTLAGTGTVNNTGAVVISSGAILSPGNNSVATLSLGALTLNSGSITNFAFGTSTNSTVASSGLLTLNGTDGIDLFQVGTTLRFTTPGTYTLFTYGSLSGTPASAFTVLNPSQGETYAFGTSGNSIVLTIGGTAAVVSTWNVDANGNYSVPGNWTNGVPNAVGATAIFGTVITAPRTVMVDGTFTLGEIDFSNTNAYTLTPAAAGNGFILSNNGNAAVISDANGSHTVATPIALALGLNVSVTNAANVLTLSGAISNTGAAGTGTLAKTGAGTLALLGANTFDGGVTITNGTVQINSASSLGAVTGTLTLDSTTNAVTLEALNSITTSRPFAVNSTNNNIQVDGTATYEIDGVIAVGTTMAGTLTKTGTGTLALGNNETFGGIVTVSAGTLSLGAGGSAGSVSGNIIDNAAVVLNRTDNYTLGNVISGTGSLTQIGTDNVTLSAANTFTGTTVISAGTLTLGNALALQASTLNDNNQGGTLSFGTLTAASLGGLSGAQNLALTNTAAGAVALTLGGSGLSSTYTGTLSGGGSLVKNGAGTVTLGSGTVGGATYTGATTINQGTLAFGGVSNITVAPDVTGLNGVASLVVQDSAVINATGTLSLATGDGGTGTVYPGASSLVVKNNASVTVGAFTFGGTANSRVPAGTFMTIQDNAVMTVNGAYTLESTQGGTASNNAVNLNGGTLAVGSFVYFPGTAGGATINFNGGLLRALAGDTSATVPFLAAATRLSTVVSTGGAIIDTNGFSDTITTTLTHGGTPALDGGLTKNGAGTLTLTAGNSYTGLTTLNAGTLNINGQFALGGAVYGGLTFNGGTLQYATAFTGNGTGDITQNSAATPVAKPVSFTSTATIDTNGNAVTYANPVGNGGAGGLTLVSTTAGGSLTLSGANTYTGATTVSSGALFVNGSVGAAGTPSGAVAVASGATLGGSGTLTVASGAVAGTLAPGATAGATTGALTLNTTSGLTLSGTLTLALNATSGVSSGTLLNTGALTLTGATLSLTGTTDGTGTTKYDLVNYSGTLNGAFASANVPAGYAINYAGTTFAASDIELDPMSAVPEPSTWLGGALLVLGLGWNINRRRSRA